MNVLEALFLTLWINEYQKAPLVTALNIFCELKNLHCSYYKKRRKSFRYSQGLIWVLFVFGDPTQPLKLRNTEKLKSLFLWQTAKWIGGSQGELSWQNPHVLFWTALKALLLEMTDLYPHKIVFSKTHFSFLYSCA